MLYDHEFQEIVKNLTEVTEKDEIYNALDHLTHFLGFKYFAIGHHVDLIHPPMASFGISNYCPHWLSEVYHEGYYNDDPIHFLCTGRNAGFVWPDPAIMEKLSEKHRFILERGAQRDFRMGYTIPVHVPGEYSGSCTFVAASDETIRPHALPIAYYAASFAFEAIRRFVRKTSGLEANSLPKLTAREREMLILMGQGKSYAEMGEIAGISRETAHQHCKNLLRSYGNIQRCNLIARALFNGHASFPEMLLRGR